MTEAQEYVEALAGLVALVNPMGAVPVFLSLTAGQTPKQIRAVALKAAVTVLVLLGGSIFIGHPMLHFFHISIASFRIAGGILILLMAISMVHAQPSGQKTSPEESAEAGDREDVAVVPLGIPLLAGPASISTVIIEASRFADFTGRMVLVGCVAITALTVWLVLTASTWIGRALGRSGINILTRLMGLLLAAIAVEFIAAGVLAFFPALARGGP